MPFVTHNAVKTALFDNLGLNFFELRVPDTIKLANGDSVDAAQHVRRYDARARGRVYYGDGGLGEEDLQELHVLARHAFEELGIDDAAVVVRGEWASGMLSCCCCCCCVVVVVVVVAFFCCIWLDCKHSLSLPPSTIQAKGHWHVHFDALMRIDCGRALLARVNKWFGRSRCDPMQITAVEIVASKQSTLASCWHQDKKTGDMAFQRVRFCVRAGGGGSPNKSCPCFQQFAFVCPFCLTFNKIPAPRPFTTSSHTPPTQRREEWADGLVPPALRLLVSAINPYAPAQERLMMYGARAAGEYVPLAVFGDPIVAMDAAAAGAGAVGPFFHARDSTRCGGVSFTLSVDLAVPGIPGFDLGWKAFNATYATRRIYNEFVQKAWQHTWTSRKKKQQQKKMITQPLALVSFSLCKKLLLVLRTSNAYI
jgi:hypothetical protein